MLRSMTGYGRGEALLYDRRFVVEIKSVNHRYGDINIRLPRTLNPFEDRLRKQIASHAARGKVDVYVSMDSSSGSDVKITLNETVADAYVEQLRKAAARYGVNCENSLSLIMGFPDVLEVDKAADAEALEQMWEGVTLAAAEALERFVAMREAEGAELARDLAEKCRKISALTEKIVERSPQVAEDYIARLRVRMDEVLADISIDENRILAEAALFADRCCVDEELTRLASHLKQLGDILDGDGSEATGRKLDFLVQEINREVNTIGSKSNDIEIARLVVDLKAEIEKVREQVQNIE